uniref:Fibrinogen C domain-containing protein 1-like n=1 Tax=Mastacembelus armatus TaxID=205130 RepID=A0A3Q3MPK2_9TELE
MGVTESILLTLALLTVKPVTHDFVASDECPDVGHDEDVHPHALTEANADVFNMNIQTNRDVPDRNFQTNWNIPDLNTNSYEDADWHPPTSHLETHLDLLPDARPVMHGSNDSNQTTSQTTGISPAQCDDVSYWLHENQNRKEQLEELRETVSELQEELRNHRHRVKALEMQGEESAGLNSTLDQRLSSLELHRAESDTLLHVHTTLLYELQAQLHNLSAAVQHMSHRAGCRVGVIRNTPPLRLRDTLPPDGPSLSFCQSDCASLYHSGVRRSGVYTIVLSPGATLPVYCDMETEGGGWMVFQRRRDGSVSFNRGWSEYRDGFGELRGEHWLGNQHLHLLSNQGHYSLRIHLQDWSHTHRHALYHSFRLDTEENQYRLHVSGFTGTVKDSFGWYHDQQGFSTPDTGNICAEVSHSGWWFHQCFYSNLNGVYYKGGHYSLKAQNLLGPDGIVWFSWKNSDFYSLKTVTMMIRPRTFRPHSSP